MTGAERQSLKFRIDAASRARLRREVNLLTYSPTVDGVRTDTRPMCEGKVGAYSLHRIPGAPCPFRAAPGSRYCGNHERKQREMAA